MEDWINEIEHEGTNEIVCPWCGYEALDSWEMSDSGDTTCAECKKGFMYAREVAVTYITAKTPCTQAHEYTRSGFYVRDQTFVRGAWEPLDLPIYYAINRCTICDCEIKAEITEQEYRASMLQLAAKRTNTNL